MNGRPPWSRRRRRKTSDPRAAEQLLAEGLEHHRAGELEEAARAYAAARGLVPNNASAHELLGGVALQRGNPAEALSCLDRAIELDPSAVGAHVSRGEALRELGRPQEAAEAYHAAIALDPNHVGAHNNLGIVLAIRGELREALEVYERALELDSDLFPAAANRARLLAQLTDAPFDERLAAVDRAIGVGRRQGINGPALAHLYHARGLAYREADRIEDAQVEFERAILTDPGYSSAYLNLGRVLEAQASYEEAVTATRKAVDKATDRSEAYADLIHLLCRLDRLDEAAEASAAWHHDEPNDPIAAHMVAALAGLEPPPRASDEYVRGVFDGYADEFDSELAKLDYRGPALAEAVVRKHLSPGQERVLDAGCGTGQCARFLRPLAREVHGVDLSSKMLEIARAGGLYDDLVESELTAYLEANPRRYDCIVATDVLIYFGALEDLAQGFATSLRPDGLLAVTLEAARDGVETYRLNAGGRYEHAETYTHETLSAAGLRVLSMDRVVLRTERDHDVAGFVVAARA